MVGVYKRLKEKGALKALTEAKPARDYLHFLREQQEINYLELPIGGRIWKAYNLPVEAFETPNHWGETCPTSLSIFINMDTSTVIREQTFWHEVAHVLRTACGMQYNELTHEREEILCDQVGYHLPLILDALVATWRKSHGNNCKNRRTKQRTAVPGDETLPGGEGAD